MQPNLIGRLRLKADLPITIGVLATLFVILFTYLFLVVPKEQKQDVAYVSGIIATASAIYAAFYAGRALHQNIHSRKVDRTVECSIRWLDSSLANSKQLTTRIAAQVVSITDEEARGKKITELIGDPSVPAQAEAAEANELAISTVFNFFEQLAVFVEQGVIEETLLQEFYLTILVKYY
ncbi:DUF4760 domain-containing protein [Pseudanabaena sp. PCC 6802]|uniref:DUF4760 domain-containing protein n=1 Tax=Pseudanabaena sp. PCC 6802 TaxID=118173 RepID=UPI0003701554|nr:DUF4760 domain-containing protein [Pseudanabaena sp. PCC 6802]